MGRPKFPRKKYDSPFHPWKEDRIKSERELKRKYGLKNNREVWKAKTFLKKYRGQARELSAKIGGKDPQVKKESDQLLLHLTKMSILPAGSSLDGVLALETESMLSRRLQTLVYHRGLANTVDHARQLISHGHIAIGGRKITIPGYMVTKDEESKIGYTAGSPLNIMSHPTRPKTDVYKPAAPTDKKEATEKKEDKKETEEKGKAEKTEEPIEPKKPEEKSEKPEEKTKLKAEIKEEKPTEESEPEEKTEEKALQEDKSEKTDVEEKPVEKTEKEKTEPTKKPEDTAEKVKEQKELVPAKEQTEAKDTADTIEETNKKEKGE